MLTVADIYEDAQSVVGSCDDPTLFRRLTEAVRILAGKGDFDPLLGDVELCSYGGCVALPNEVEVVTAVSIDGQPITGRNRWFNYHINGPGERHRWQQCSGWQYWRDGAQSPVIQDITVPAKIVAFLSQPEDNGKKIRVFGTDLAGNTIRSKENDVWVDGYLIPTVFGSPVQAEDAPVFARVTRVLKDQFVGWVRLSTIDGSDDTGALIGLYQWWETDPQYKRIHLPRLCKTACNSSEVLTPHLVRISFRRRIFKIRSKEDIIPFDNSIVLMEALRAVKYYGDNDLASGSGHEATAARLLTEEQNTRIPPVVSPVQISDQNMLVDKTDYMN